MAVPFLLEFSRFLAFDAPRKVDVLLLLLWAWEWVSIKSDLRKLSVICGGKPFSSVDLSISVAFTIEVSESTGSVGSETPERPSKDRMHAIAYTEVQRTGGKTSCGCLTYTTIKHRIRQGINIRSSKSQNQFLCINTNYKV